MSWRVKNFALAALCLAMTTGLGAWADFAKTNPVTGETENYTWKFVGTDTWDGTGYWQNSDGANPTGVPAKSGDNTWEPILFDGGTINITGDALSVEGWDLRMGLYSGAKVTLNNLVKLQGDTTLWFTVDDTSKLTVAGFGKGNLSANQVIKCSTSAASGIEWSVNLECSGTANNTFEYYLAGDGSVSYQGVTAANHKIKQADATITGGAKAVKSKTLVTFTSTDKTFTADAGIKLKDALGTQLSRSSVSTVRQSGAVIAGTTSDLTTSDAVGTCEIVQATDGIILYYVDGPVGELATYKPSININFTHNGNSLNTEADLGLAGYEVPGSAWNNIAGVEGSTSGTIKKIDATGAAAVDAGVSVAIPTASGSYSCYNLTSGTELQHGYVDDNNTKSTPTVSITGIPYANYRVVVYHATDTANYKFGYDTVNGTNFTYADGVLAVGTASWGNSGPEGGANPIEEGVNTLVSGVMSDSAVTIVGHRVNGDNARGCIAAIQIVEVDIGTDDLVISMTGDKEYSVSETKHYNRVIVTGTGTLTLAGAQTITADSLEIEKNVVVVMDETRLAATTVTGEGTARYDGVVPPTGKGWTDSSNWTGTVWIRNKSGITGNNNVTTGVQPNNLGNINSKVKFSGVSGWIEAPITYNPEIVLENDSYSYALQLTNGNSPNDTYVNRCTEIKKLSGSGTLSCGGTSTATPTLKVYDWSEFTGSIDASATSGTFMVVIFCEEGEELPDSLRDLFIATNLKRTIYISAAADVTVAGTWKATNGVIVNGRLSATGIGKFGASTGIKISDTGVLTLTSTGNVDDTAVNYSNITGTGTIKYSGSGWRALPNGGNLFPSTLAIELEQADGVVVQENNKVIGSISGTKNLRSDLGSSDKTLTIKQARDGVWSGSFYGGGDRLKTVVVDPGASTTGTLTLAGTHTHDNELTVNGSVNLTGTWVGDTTVTGTIGGTGTLNGDLTLSTGAKLKVFGVDDDGLKITGAFAYPADDSKIAVEIDSGLDLDGIYYISLLSGLAAADIDTARFELADTSLPYEVIFEGGELGLLRSGGYRSIYNDYVTFTLNGIGTTPITNYTLLVRISEDQFPGFKYYRAGDGSQIAFTDGHGKLIAHEVDTWNPAGVSLVWVKVPEAVNGAKITFYWSLKDDATAPGNDPTAVWTDYAGVWHMKDATDSTANKATGEMGSSASATANGFLGGAIGASVTGVNGALVSVETNAAINALADSGFTVSGWVCLNTVDAASWAYLFTKKLTDSTDAWGLQFYGDGSHGQAYNSRLWVNGSGSGYFTHATPFVVGQWHYITLVFAKDGGSKVSWYMDGSALVSNNAVSWDYGTDGFSIGGLPVGHGTLNGKMDEVRLRKGVISTTQIQAEISNANQKDFFNAVIDDGVSFLVPNAVVSEGRIKDYWRVMPSLSQTSWDIGSTPSITYTPGVLRSGAAIEVTCETDAGTYKFDFDGDPALLTAISEIGAYRLHFSRKDKTNADVEDEYVYFTITKPSGMNTVGDTASGRILLMNNDFSQGGTADAPSIGSQGYSDTNTENSVYWQFADREISVLSTMNIMDGTNSVLLYVDGSVTNKLWHLVSCRHGNTFPSNGSTILEVSQNYLPYSNQSCTITNGSAAVASCADAGQIVMQNVLGAAVYSPCYTTGIGTIYFDAVNGWTNNIANYKELSGDTSNTNAYQLVVEISTADATVDSTEIPDDEWSAVESHIVRVSGTDPRLSEVEASEKIKLEIADGGKLTEFYRIYVPVEERGTVRFRIRRVGVDNKDDAANPMPDANAYILLDNIVVSYPRMTADLRPAGEYFAKSGKDVLGVEGAFIDDSGKAVLPVAGDKIYGRAVPEYYVNASTNLTATNFIASARMHYRWRYLNQLFGSWRVESLDIENGFKSVSELTVPDMVGDVEFWFDATLQMPYYEYADYSGQGLADEFSAIYTEKVTEVANTASAAESFGYPTMGTDWFVRLREIPAGREGVYLITKPSGSSVCETNSMYIVTTNQWRGLVKTESALDDGLEFRFEGVSLVSDESGSVAFTTNAWKAASNLTDSLPASTGLDFSEGWSKTMCDGKTGYLLFSYDEERATISVCRGDWQDFNHWSSAATNLFVGSSIDTNSTSYVTKDYFADIANWPVSESTNVNWTIDFDVPSSLKCEEVYPRDTPIAETNDPLRAGWTMKNLSWTDQKWAYSGADSEGWGGKSAVQLEGRGHGSISYVSDSDYPDGLESVIFSTRLAQFNEFGNFAYYQEGSNTVTDALYFPTSLKNYTFITYGALTMDKVEQDYDGDGSLSLVAYYHPAYGAYEARVSRGGSNGTTLRITFFKWYAKTGGMACKKIGYKEFPNAAIDGLLKTNNNIGMMCRFYISAQEATIGGTTGTIIHAGVSNAAKDTSLTPTATVYSEGQYESIVYFDTDESTRLKKGTFGVLARNCAGMAFKPAFLDSGITQINGSDITSFTKKNTLDRYQTCSVTFSGSSSGSYPIYGGSDTATVKAAKRDAWYEGWVLPPGRTVRYENEGNPDYWGFAAVTNVTQTLYVQTTPHGGSDWTTITNLTITGFKNVTYTNYVYSNTPCDIRLQVGGVPDDPRLDVTVDDISLTKWNGEYTEGYADNYGYPTNYVYTSAWVVQDDDEIGQKAVRLQPARAKADNTPVSLRSAVLNGAGLFHFDWRNADVGNTKLLLQKYEYATVSMEGRLRYATEASADSTVYKWTTIGEPITVTEASGGKTFFLNERYDGKNSVVLRLIVDPTVVAAARAGDDPDYGAIEITDSYAWDLPPYDKHSWTGWNFRTDGWSDSMDSMWANLTDFKSGLSGLLNNSIDPVTLAEPTRADAYKGHMPYVQSPTFETNCIGSVEFRARLYNPEVDVTAGYPAFVTVYGAKREKIDSEGEPTEWTKLADVEVSSTIYAQKSVKFKSGDQYCVLRLSVRGVPGVEAGESDGDTSPDAGHNPPLRVALDDICILERPIPSVRFKKGYARPFRNSDLIKTTDPVLDIATSAEQPILGETFGFQAEVELNDLEGVIVTDDPSKPIRVYVAYYPYKDSWGWKNWIDTTNEVGKAVVAELVKADGTDLVFRSTLDNSDSFCPAQFAGGDEKLKYWNYRLVQYHFFATYYDTSGELHAGDEAHNLEQDEWAMPEWDNGFADPNSNSSYFSAFTLLESLAPKQAWINEVNLTDSEGLTSDKTNQWIEIAVPTDVDMKGWSVRYYNNFDVSDPLVGDLFYFNGSNKTSANNASEASKDYSFYVAISPQTTTISKTDAHAVWDAITSHGVQQGALPSYRPSGFELVRSSGVVEHSVVIQGYNEWENTDNTSAARSYSGTNFVAQLKATVGGDWVWGEEDKWNYYGYTAGVTNNMGGAHEDWSSPMKPTPFAINKNQVIGDDWYILPNGGYYRIYANISGDHIGQLFGDQSGDSITITVSEGVSTNIVYTVDKWYKLTHETDHPAERTVLDDPVTLGDGRLEYKLHLNSISNTVKVSAVADISDEVAALIPEGDEGDAYKPAIMKWLANGRTGKGAGTPFAGTTLTNAYYRGHDGSISNKIDLVGMYWLDLDPTQPGWELWGGMGAYGKGTATNRVLAASTTNRWHSTWNIMHTNMLVSAWLMITNTETHVVYPPYRLQGVSNEKSDEYTGNDWTSVTFKVSMQLSTEGKWRDMSYFVFDDNSFAPATSTTIPPFTTIIEITDPHSRQSMAYDWDWWRYPTVTPWSKWKIDIDSVPLEPAVLRKEHYLDGDYP